MNLRIARTHRTQLALAAALFTANCTPSARLSPTSGSGEAQAPEFVAVATSGREVAVPPRAPTKVALVCFWASWCPACQAALPELDGIWRDERHNGVMLIGVSLDESQAQAEAMAQRLGASFPIVMDETVNAAARYGAGKIPLLVAVDRTGAIRWSGNDPAAARDVVEDLIRQ